MNGKSDGLIPTVPILFVLLSIIVRRKIQAKKIAMGHKPDDHEEEQNQGGMVMGGM